MEIVENLYQTLKRQRDEKRIVFEKTKQEPLQLVGVFWPSALKALGKDYALQDAAMQSMRIHGANIENVVGEIGWDKLLATMEEKEGPTLTRQAIDCKKELGITSDSPFDIRVLNSYWNRGTGFHPNPATGKEGQRWVEMSDERVEVVGDWCPQIEGLKQMGFTDPFDWGIWCDAIDSCLARAINPRVQYLHINCLGKGDKYCRIIIERCKDKDEILNYDSKPTDKGESFYQKTMRLRKEKCEEVEKLEPEPPDVPGFPQGFTPGGPFGDDVSEIGAKRAFKTITQTICYVGDTLGWMKFINLIGEKQSWGFSKAASARRKNYKILGDTLRDAATLAVISYTGLGFDKHKLIRYTDKAVEGIADWCPIVQVANEMGLDKKIEDVSLWCDFYHNFDVHAVNPNFQLVHTHCLGRSDKYCRFVIE